MNRRRALVIDGRKVVATALFAGSLLRANTSGEAAGLITLAIVFFALAFYATPEEDDSS